MPPPAKATVHQLRNEARAINNLPEHATIAHVEQWVNDNIADCWMNSYSVTQARRILSPPHAGHPTTTLALTRALVEALDKLQEFPLIDRRTYWHGHHAMLVDVAGMLAAPDYPGGFRLPSDLRSRLLIHVAVA